MLQPRRSAAKTLVAKAVRVSSAPAADGEVGTALIDALSALDRAAKAGAIHPNAAARRKSRLVLKVNAAVGGTQVVAGAHVAKQVSKAQAQKAAKARIAAGRADKAKGAQTAAGKARAALTKTTRTEGAAAAPDTTAPSASPSRPAAKAKAATTKAAKTTASAKAGATKSSAKPAAKPAAKKTAKS